MDRIVLFDGDCSLCNKSVQFIIKRDVKKQLYFSSLQSDYSTKALQHLNAKLSYDSLVFIEHNRVYVKSSAALHICKYLRGLWKLCYLLIIVPKPFRDFVYNILATYRYKWFGKAHNCRIATPEEQKRFLT